MDPIKYTDYIMHWGIKGQKWGVRRFQNEDGTLTEAGKKRYYKEHVNEFDNDALEYMSEYDKTKEGKAKLKKYYDAQDNWDNEPDYKTHPKENKKFWDDFSKVEDDYLKSSQKYAGKKLLEKYGEKDFRLFVEGGDKGWKMFCVRYPATKTMDPMERFIAQYTVHRI